MFTVHIIVRSQYKTLKTESSMEASQFVYNQTFHHSVTVDRYNGAKGAFVSIHEGNRIVGHFVIEKD